MWSKRLSRATWAPSPSTSSARPLASRCSSVRAWTPNARVRLDSVSRRSSTVTSTPACARSPASSRPVGPAPTMATVVCTLCMVIRPFRCSRRLLWAGIAGPRPRSAARRPRPAAGPSANQPAIASGAVPSRTSATRTPVRAGSQAARTSAMPLAAPIGHEPRRRRCRHEQLAEAEHAEQHLRPMRSDRARRFARAVCDGQRARRHQQGGRDPRQDADRRRHSRPGPASPSAHAARCPAADPAGGPDGPPPGRARPGRRSAGPARPGRACRPVQSGMTAPSVAWTRPAAPSSSAPAVPSPAATRARVTASPSRASGAASGGRRGPDDRPGRRTTGAPRRAAGRRTAGRTSRRALAPRGRSVR